MILLAFTLCLVGATLGDPTGDPRIIEIEDYVEGYYWRYYTSDIPRDALPAGVLPSGEKTFIGQTLNNRFLIPGEIRPGDNKIYFEQSGKSYTSTENIMILCTQNPEQFEWVKTSKTKFQDLLKKRQLIEGGYENKVYHIGRASIENQKIVGKITADGVKVPYKGDGKTYETFEALVFNADVPVKNVKSKSKKTVRITINN